MQEVYLCSMLSPYSNTNLVANTLSLVSVAYKYMDEGYYPALHQASNALAYMSLPGIIAYASPQLAGVYTAGMLGYGIYSAISKAHELYHVRESHCYKMQSIAAYRDATKLLSEVTGLEFFREKAQYYEEQAEFYKVDLYGSNCEELSDY